MTRTIVKKALYPLMVTASIVAWVVGLGLVAMLSDRGHETSNLFGYWVVGGFKRDLLQLGGALTFLFCFVGMLVLLFTGGPVTNQEV